MQLKCPLRAKTGPSCCRQKRMDTGTKKGLGSCAELYGGSNSRLCPAPSPGDLQGMVPQAAYQFAIGLAISDPCFVIACPNEASR